MSKPHKGQVLLAKKGVNNDGTPLRADITSVTKDSVTVEVERMVGQRHSELKVEVRTRTIPLDLWPHFVQGYEVASS